MRTATERLLLRLEWRVLDDDLACEEGRRVAKAPLVEAVVVLANQSITHGDLRAKARIPLEQSKTDACTRLRKIEVNSILRGVRPI